MKRMNSKWIGGKVECEKHRDNKRTLFLYFCIKTKSALPEALKMITWSVNGIRNDLSLWTSIDWNVRLVSIVYLRSRTSSENHRMSTGTNWTEWTHKLCWYSIIPNPSCHKGNCLYGLCADVILKCSLIYSSISELSKWSEWWCPVDCSSWFWPEYFSRVQRSIGICREIW